MDILALGYSNPTPVEGIEADVIVVRSFEELKKEQDKVGLGQNTLVTSVMTSYDHTARYDIDRFGTCFG